MCPCCNRGQIARNLALWLELLREAWNAPVFVNSGWRCAARNARVGGAALSRHLIGCAADIRPRYPMEPEFFALAERLFRRPGWEFLRYDSFLHVTVPRDEAAELWDGGVISL